MRSTSSRLVVCPGTWRVFYGLDEYVNSFARSERDLFWIRDSHLPKKTGNTMTSIME